MRRETRRHENKENNRNILYLGGSLIGIGVIAFAITFILYGNKMEEQGDISSQKIATLVQEAANDSKSASSQMGKTVEESANDITNVESTNTNTSTTNTNTSTKTENTSNTTNTVNTTKSNETAESTKNNEQTAKENSVTAKEKEEQQKVEEQKDPEFVKPVEGEISKEYAKDNLVYSETLQEWTTHMGIDIKADKTTVVKASADGKIKSIKNDPRYGLSIIIEHQNGFETLYANLLTSEFVEVGEEVKQGQSIGTVGNTATFEIADDAHLHFEITKNNENLDPTQYIK